MRAFYTSPMGRVFPQLLANATQDETASTWLRERFLASREHGIQQLWNRARSRGEVRNDVDPDTAIDLLFGPLMWRLMSGHRPLSEADASEITDAALSGLFAQGS